MKQKEILEYNKRCAEFLGYINLTPDDKDFDFYEKLDGVLGKMLEPKSMKFHSDWNWIMEVVEKIQTLDKLGGIVMIQQGRCKITSRMAGDNSVYADVSHYYLHGMKKQKEAVVQAINQFLIWYNDSSRNN